MAKKILSLALVVVMLMSMFVFSTSAADLTDGQIGFRVETEGLVEGAPEGTIVTLKVYYVIPEGAELTNALGNTAVAYNSAKFEYVAESCQWGDFYAEGFSAPSATSVSTNVSKTLVKKYTADEQAKWNAGLQVKQTYIPLSDNGPWSATTGYPVTDEDVFFSLQFKALEDITAEDSIGIPTGAYSSTFFKINDFTKGAYAKDSVVLDDAVATPDVPAAANKIYAVKNGKQVQWADQANDKINLGVKAGFKSTDIDLALNGGTTSTKIKFVGAMVSKNGDEAIRGTTPFVYDVNRDGSEYQYRVVIKDVDRTSEDVYTVTFFAEDFDGNIIPGDTTTITAAEVISKLPA